MYAPLSLLLTLLITTSLPAQQHAENLFIVTLDGFRWQEMFGGAQEMLLDAKAGGVKDVRALREAYWRPTPEARRAALMPFIWGTLAKQGQIFGDPDRSATALSTNGLKFSYPGYSEMFTGVVDPTVDSNGKKDNPNLSVLEYLDGLPQFRGKVAPSAPGTSSPRSSAPARTISASSPAGSCPQSSIARPATGNSKSS